MGKTQKQISTFQLEGRFLGYEIEDGYKIKRLHLATPTGEHSIKLSKEARVSLGRVLTPGEWLRVQGEVKLDLDTGVQQFKAFFIQAIAQPVTAPPPENLPRSQEATPMVLANPTPKAKSQAILVCQKSDCMKRGGKDLCPRLQAELRDRGLAEQVTIRGTGCMKQCKAGPNLVMPDKTRYSRISAQDLPTLLDQHFPASTVSPSVGSACVS